MYILQTNIDENIRDGLLGAYEAAAKGVQVILTVQTKTPHLIPADTLNSIFALNVEKLSRSDTFMDAMDQSIGGSPKCTEWITDRVLRSTNAIAGSKAASNFCERRNALLAQLGSP